MASETGGSSGVSPIATPTLSAPAAQVQIGNVPDDGSTLFDGSALAGAAISSAFDDYLIINRFEADGNRYMSGLTSPDGFEGDSVAFFQLFTPTLLWICDWTIEVSSNEQPPMPSETAPEGWVFLDKGITPSSIMVQGDGSTPIYRISGTYVYGAKNPATAQPFYPRPPWLQDSLDRFVNTDRFVEDLKDYQGSNAGGGGSVSEASEGNSANLPSDASQAFPNV